MKYLLFCLLSLMAFHGMSTGADETARPAWTASKLKGAPTPPAPYRVKPAFPNVKFDRPTGLEEIPGENRLLVTEMNGKVLSLPKSADVKTPDLIANLDEVVGADVSLFSAALHPKFQTNRFLFACYLHPENGRQVRISRFTLTSEVPHQVVARSEVVMVTRPAGPHNAGCLLFGKDGMLYAATGDGFGPNPPDGLNTGQDLSDLLGNILRIDVDRPSELAGKKLPYTVPADNPFVGQPGIRPEIWAYGLRNPWKFGIDRDTGDIFAADNGWETWEMIHKIERGGNCGWPLVEGRAVLRTDVKPGPTPIIPCIKDHSHTEANSVIGGPVYRGSKLPGLNGSFVYGDYITGTIWAVWPEKQGDKTTGWGNATLVDTDLQIVGFAEGSAGELFVLDYDFTGQIYELLPSGRKDTSATFPRRLSETGLFASLDDLRPAAGVVPYDVIASRWADGAEATRWVGIPGSGRINLANGEPGLHPLGQFPDGTVFAKQLSLPQPGRKPIRLETQILLYDDGEWTPYSYLWDESGKDATLVDAAGAARTLSVADGHGGQVERTWKVSAINECRLCHNAGANNVLGFVPNQLARQLGSLAARQVIAAAPPAVKELRLVDPHDASQPLDDRARSYLHANCSMCHHPRGNAIVGFFLRRDMPFEKLNTNRGTIIGTFGMEHAKVIASGDPFRSILTYRMSKLGYGRMPYIGSHVVDGAGVALIADWIRSLKPQDDHRSPPLLADSSEATAVRTLLGPGDRAAAIRTLTSSTSGSLALLAKLHAGALADADRAAAVSAGSQKPSDIAGLFETFLPESQRRARLGPKPDPQSILKLTGDVSRGKLIYFSDTARCRNCHEHTDADKSIGPTLADINKKTPQPGEMLLHVLEPSRRIDDKFAAYVVTTTRGQVVSGLLVRESPQEIVLKTAERKIVTIPVSDLDDRQRSPKSLMPDGILSDLTAQEAADLLAYVRAVSSP